MFPDLNRIYVIAHKNIQQEIDEFKQRISRTAYISSAKIYLSISWIYPTSKPHRTRLIFDQSRSVHTRVSAEWNEPRLNSQRIRRAFDSRRGAIGPANERAGPTGAAASVTRRFPRGARRPAELHGGGRTC